MSAPNEIVPASGPRGFFAIDARIVPPLCELGMNPATAYVVLASGTGRTPHSWNAADSYKTFWSVHSIEKYTGISRQRARRAIDTLIAKGFVTTIAVNERQAYRLNPPQIPDHRPKPDFFEERDSANLCVSCKRSVAPRKPRSSWRLRFTTTTRLAVEHDGSKGGSMTGSRTAQNRVPNRKSSPNGKLARLRRLPSSYLGYQDTHPIGVGAQAIHREGEVADVFNQQRFAAQILYAAMARVAERIQELALVDL